jgi:hypothetical protein
MSKSFAGDFIKSFDGFALPEDLSGRFDILECLAVTDYAETYLLTEKDGGKRFVLKCHKKSDEVSAVREAELLRGLEHKGLPSFEREAESGDTLFILREYIEGVPLDRYLSEYQPDEAQAVKIVIELCDVLSYLHSQPSPIIHRDIKPSNIIICAHDNSVKLIDFGISRKYVEGAAADTAFFGTRSFAPPEQYGFSQTDRRADIYALGVVLRFILTGKTDGQIQEKDLARIVEKCTAFSPQDRYQSADAVKRALLSYGNRTKQKAARAAVSVLVVCAAIAVGFAIGRYTDVLAFPIAEIPGDGVYVFNDFLVEQTIRAALGKAEGEAVYRSDLSAVRNLHFIGDGIISGEEDFREIIDNIYWHPSSIKYGSLKDLSDLRYMENLAVINIVAQPIEDLTPLAECLWLVRVNFIDCNDLTDLSPLANCERLEEIDLNSFGALDFSSLTASQTLRSLSIHNGRNVDFSDFENMNFVRKLHIGRIPLHSITELGNMTQIDRLELTEMALENLDGIENLTSLTVLALNDSTVRDFSPLNALPSLRELIISPDMEQYLNTLNRDNIQVIVNG